MSKFILVALGLLLASEMAGCTKDKAPTGSRADTSPATDPDPHWVVQQQPAAKVALVYVHGVTGDMVGTWTAPNGKTFFQLVDENPVTHGKADAFVFGFPSYIFKRGSFDIREAANRLHQRLEFHGVLKYPAVVFVAHSMGGLVVLRELLTHREVLEKVPVVVFYATPMEGSLLAAIGKQFSPNSALAQMTPAEGNALLQTLDDEWKSIPDDKRPHVRCAYENKAYGPAKIVSWASATRFCEGATPAIEANHLQIVKPDRSGADAIVVLANALNTYVLGRELEARLETPDFTPEGDHEVFVLTDVLGRQKARLVNAGGTGLRFTLAEPSDPGLFLWPDDTPRVIPPASSQDLNIALARGANASEYHFKIRTEIAPDRKVVVRVPDLLALNAQQAQIAERVAAKLNAFLSDPQQFQELVQAAADDNSVPEKVVRIAHDEIARDSQTLPDSGQWVLAADLLASMNWPGLATRALRNAEKASSAVTKLPGVQQLAGVLAAQSGEARVFSVAQTPIVDSATLAARKVDQPLVRPETAPLASELAERMQQVPALKFLGLTLEGDVQQAKGDVAAAHEAFSEAATIRATPAVSGRLQQLNTVKATRAGASVRSSSRSRVPGSEP